MPRLRAPQPVRGFVGCGSVDRQLTAARSIWLATARPSGEPHAMPVWFWWDGGHKVPRLYFITARPTQKARNLAHRATVVAHLGDGDDVVIVHGHARMVRNRRELERVDGAYRAKYVDPYRGAQASVFDNPLDDVYRVDAERVVAWMYGVVDAWTEWRFEAAARQTATRQT